MTINKSFASLLCALAITGCASNTISPIKQLTKQTAPPQVSLSFETIYNKTTGHPVCGLKGKLTNLKTATISGVRKYKVIVKDAEGNQLTSALVKFEATNLEEGRFVGLSLVGGSTMQQLSWGDDARTLCDAAVDFDYYPAK